MILQSNCAEEKTTQQMKKREKKLWNRLGHTAIELPPIFLQKKHKFVPQYWDFDAVTPAAPPQIGRASCRERVSVLG